MLHTVARGTLIKKKAYKKINLCWTLQNKFNNFAEFDMKSKNSDLKIKKI